MIHFLLFVSRPMVVEEISGFGEVPRDMITVSTSISYSDPGISTGRLLPDASGSPSSIFTRRIPFTQSFSSTRISYRVGQKVKNDTLFFCVMNFLCTGRKLSFATTVNDMYLSAETKSGSCSIHSYVSAANNCNFLAVCDWCIIVITESFHQVVSGQELVGREYAVGVLTRDSHEHRKTSTGTDEYSFKALFVHQLVDGGGFTDNNVGLDLNTESLYVLNLFLYNSALRKTELRNTIYQYAAGFVKSLKDGYIVTHFCQIAGTGQSGRTRTDDGYLLAVFLSRSIRFDTVLACPVSYETLQFTDGNRFSFDTADTFTLTLALLGADTSADSGKCAGLGR